jgi:Reverse transcriptase (RNA-dependent DNA polymerase)
MIRPHNAVIDILDEHLDYAHPVLTYKHLTSIIDVTAGIGDLFVIHINIRSIKTNFDHLKVFIDSLPKPPDLIVLSEIWIVENLKNLFVLPGYNLEIKTRLDSSYGGVGCYIADSLDYTRLVDIEPILTECESLCLKITDSRLEKPLIVTCIYRAPKTNYFRFCDSLGVHLGRTQSLGEQLVCGDCNLNYLELDKHYQFFNTFLQYGLKACITGPTRIVGNAATSIDCIFSTLLKFSCKAGTFIADIADHLTIYSVFKLKNDQQTRGYSNMFYTKTNNVGVKNKLQNCDWTMINDTVKNNVNEGCDKLVEKIELTITQETTTKRYNKKRNPYNPWFTPGLLRSYRKKLKLYTDYKKNPTLPQKELVYKNYVKHYNRLIVLAKRLYYNKHFTKESDIKKKWQTLKTSIGLASSKKSTIKEIKKINSDEMVTDPVEVSQIFNSFFATVGDRLAEGIPATNRSPLDTVDQVQSIFSFNQISRDIILLTLKELNSKPSVDKYGMSNKLLKYCSVELSVPLTVLLNEILSTGIFPDRLKVAKVIPLFKAGCVKSVDNYRPISLVPVIGKLFEKVIHAQINAYLQEHSLIAKQQFGFQKNVSTTMALMSLHNYILEAMNNKNMVTVLFVDLSKAFDTVSHDILIQKLGRYGFTDESVALIQSYLADRKQYVSVDGTDSDELSISIGVPQGSVLGPLLFLIYINDLVKILPNVILFADDTALFRKHKFFQLLREQLQADIDLLDDWLKANKLSLNVAKTKYIVFKPPEKPLLPEAVYFTIRGVQLQKVSSIKYLGLVIDERLSWNEHIKHVSNKISKFIYIFSKAKHYHDRNVLKLIYTSFVYPHLLYGIELYGHAGSTILNSLFLIMKRMVRIITRSPNIEHSAPLFKELQLQTLNQIFVTRLAFFMFNIVNRGYRTLHINLKTPLPGLVTRGGAQLKLIPNQAINYFGQRMIEYCGSILWNKLPNAITEIVSVSVFKIQIRIYLVENLINIYVSR